MLAFAELLDCPVDASAHGQRTSEETSMQYFWAARKAIVLAPTFSGESPDLVRSGILVSRYLVSTRAQPVSVGVTYGADYVTKGILWSKD